jgi:hypothetical protein
MKKLIIISTLVIICSIMYSQTEPEWLWATGSQGSSDEFGRRIATDSNGNSYITGIFGGALTLGTTTLTSNGSMDIFVAKLDANGNYLWAKQAGGASLDEGLDVCTDNAGNCYVTGFFQGTVTFGSTTLTSSNGNISVFISKLDSAGNWLWTKQAGGTWGAQAWGISTDNAGNCYVTGEFNVGAGFGEILVDSYGGTDIFVTKLDSTGNFLWAVNAGGSTTDKGFSLSTDSNGNSYVTGNFSGNATFGTIQRLSTGSYDVFVAKLDTDGNWLRVSQAGGPSYDSGNDIAIDSAGNSYVTGSFITSATFGTTSFTSMGNDDIFVTKLDNNGNWLWASPAGGTEEDQGWGISIDSSGNSYITGYFDIAATFGTTSLISSGSQEIFISSLDTNGNWLWSVKAGGTDLDRADGVATDSSGNICVTGGFMYSAVFGPFTRHLCS